MASADAVSEPVEPPPTAVRFPDPRRATRDVLAVGTDFRAGTLLAAYRQGIFPWPQGSGHEGDLVAWFSPDPRTLMPLDAIHWSRSLRRTLRQNAWTITVDAAFPSTMLACGDREEGTWITPEVIAGYTRLHELGWAHSLEVWEDRELVGGIYGVAIGASFAAESMFHRRTDASKVAFATLAENLRDAGYAIFDAQVMNPHLESLGCVEIPRAEYLKRLARAIATTPKSPIHSWKRQLRP
ncbi:MAG TPA: leucyl/phenylalanyl-tRNA--protein transferase [Polyangiaceae bacterium]